MKRTTITEDGDQVIREFPYVYGASSLVIVEQNADAAEVIIGYGGEAGEFIAYPGGTLTSSGGIVNHRAMTQGDVTLMARVTGINTNAVVLVVQP